jgi:hypothetical protein
MSLWQKGWWIPTKHLKEYLFWNKKGWWISIKYFIECLYGILKASGYPPSFLKKLIFASKRLVDTYQAFYRISLWQKGLWDTYLAFYRNLLWHKKGWWIPTKLF